MGEIMRNLLFVLALLLSFNSFATYKTASQILYKQNLESPVPTALISSAQSFTASWASLGSQQTTGGFSSMGLYLNLDINDSANARIRALALHTTGGATYLLPIKTTGASSIAVEDEYLEFNVDEDQKMILSWDLDRVIPFVQFQVQVGTVGTTAAQIDDANLILRWR